MSIKGRTITTAVVGKAREARFVKAYRKVIVRAEYFYTRLRAEEALIISMWASIVSADKSAPQSHSMK
jgi:hypothetical protein